MSDVDKLSRLRDEAKEASRGPGRLAYAIDNYLGDLPPPTDEKWSWDPNKIKWEEARGPSGSYERSADINNPEFKALLRDLGEHQGKLTRCNVFYWVFQRGTTVGRRKRDC